MTPNVKDQFERFDSYWYFVHDDRAPLTEDTGQHYHRNVYNLTTD